MELHVAQILDMRVHCHVNAIMHALFDNQPDLMTRFLVSIVNEPIVFTATQMRFHKALLHFSALQPLDVEGSSAAMTTTDNNSSSSSYFYARRTLARQVAVHVQYASTEYGRIGTERYQLTPFIQGLCTLLASGNTMRNTVMSLAEVPGRITRAFFYFMPSHYSSGFALRRWFFKRFVNPAAAELALWTNDAYAPVQTPEFFDIIYMDHAYREMSPDSTSDEAKQHLRRLTQAHTLSTLDTTTAVAQRAMELQTPRLALTFHAYIIMCATLARHAMSAERTKSGGGVAAAVAAASSSSSSSSSLSLSLLDCALEARMSYEVCMAMLYGDLDDELLPVIVMRYHKEPRFLQRLADIAEESRQLLSDPSSPNVPALLRATYMRTVDYPLVYMANLQINNSLCSWYARRRNVELNYVPLRESPFSTLLGDLVRTAQVVQLQHIKRFVQTLPSTQRPDIARMLDDTLTQLGDAQLSADSTLYNQQVDMFLSAWRLPGNVHMHRALWTFEYYLRTCPLLFESTTTTTTDTRANVDRFAFVGTDYHGPFMVLPRRTMFALQLAMLVDALTSRHYRKPTAVYPVLARLYIAERVPEASSVFAPPPPATAAAPHGHLDMDHYSLTSFLAVLAHWLYVPLLNQDTLFQYDGVPDMRSDAFGSMYALHRIVESVYTGSIATHRPEHANSPHHYTVVCDIDALNAVRGFVMLCKTHSFASLSALRRFANVVRVQCDSAASQRGHDIFTQLHCALSALIAYYESTGMRVAEEIAPVSEKKPAAKRARNSSNASLAKHHRRVALDVDVHPAVLTHCAKLYAGDGPHLLLTLQSSIERNTLLTQWVYEFALQQNVLTAAQLYQVLWCEFGVDTQLDESAFCAPIYSCGLPAVETWDRSEEYLRHLDANTYRHQHYRLREVFAREHAPQSYVHLVLLLQQLERLVCLGASAEGVANSLAMQANKSSSSSSAAATTTPVAAAAAPTTAKHDLSEQDMRIVRCLSEFYSRANSAHSSMVPVSAYFDSEQQQYHLAFFETSMCVVDLLAPRTGPREARRASQRERSVYSHDKVKLSDIAIDMTTMHGTNLREPSCADPTTRYALFRQLNDYVARVSASVVSTSATTTTTTTGGATALSQPLLSVAAASIVGGKQQRMAAPKF